jgi:hypothetical protein
VLRRQQRADSGVFLARAFRAAAAAKRSTEIRRVS